MFGSSLPSVVCRKEHSYLRYLCSFAHSGDQHIVYPILPVSLDCFCFVLSLSCVPYVASFSGLSIFDCPFDIIKRLLTVQ